MIFTQRVYRTNDGRYVAEGDPDAAFLAHTVGEEIADRLAVERGLEAFTDTKATEKVKADPDGAQEKVQAPPRGKIARSREV